MVSLGDCNLSNMPAWSDENSFCIHPFMGTHYPRPRFKVTIDIVVSELTGLGSIKETKLMDVWKLSLEKSGIVMKNVVLFIQ